LQRKGALPKVDPYLDSGRLNALQIMLTSRLEQLLGELGVDAHRSKKLYYGCCPIHGGDNPGALNLYIDGESVPGYWKCNTRKCHDHFKRTIIGFIRGVLSHQRFDWTVLRDREATKKQKILGWRETVDWCCKFIGQDIRDIKVDYDELEKRRFAAEVASFTRRPEQEKRGITRATVRKFLKIPCDYFVRRGWSPEILDRYDVGLYPAPGKPLSGRVAVPIYDEEHKFVAGFTGRSVHEQCSRCKRWHDPQAGCPDRGDRVAWGRTAKWYNHQFNKESYLYSYWFARKAIRETNTVVLVEGPGDVWRLSEAGVNYALGLFGSELSDEQQVILEMSGAMNVIVLTDMDEAGDEAREQLKQRLQRSFRLHFPLLKVKDLGEMPVERVRVEVVPVLEQIAKRSF
jgi:5S rRNA maturation endonuclease (ribonuclease M5)